MCGGGGGDVDPLQESALQKQLSKIAVKKYNDYLARYRPLENRLIAEVNTTPAEMNQVAGLAASASEQQFNQAQDTLRDRLLAQENPQSGAFQAAMSDFANKEALGTGLNVAGAEQAMAQQQARGQLGVLSLARGESANAITQFGSAASAAQSQAINDARAALKDSLDDNRLLGLAAGVGAAVATGNDWTDDTSATTDFSGWTPGQNEFSSPNTFVGGLNTAGGYPYA